MLEKRCLSRFFSSLMCVFMRHVDWIVYINKCFGFWVFINFRSTSKCKTRKIGWMFRIQSKIQSYFNGFWKWWFREFWLKNELEASFKCQRKLRALNSQNVQNKSCKLIWTSVKRTPMVLLCSYYIHRSTHSKRLY